MPINDWLFCTDASYASANRNSSSTADSAARSSSTSLRNPTSSVRLGNASFSSDEFVPDKPSGVVLALDDGKRSTNMSRNRREIRRYRCYLAWRRAAVRSSLAFTRSLRPRTKGELSGGNTGDSGVDSGWSDGERSEDMVEGEQGR